MDHSYKCSACCNKFTRKKNLYAHLRRIHKIEPISSKSTKHLSCNVCGKSFSCRSSLSRHLRTFHALEYEQDYSNTVASRKIRLICPYETCNEELLYYENLRQHILEDHGIEVQCETLTFDSIKDFDTWKEDIQQKTCSLYTKDTGSKPLKGGVTRTFMNCHRSYVYKNKGNNIRITKSIGTNKIGRACPSRLEVTVKEGVVNEPVVSVKYWKTHCGHTQEIERITPNKEKKINHSHVASKNIELGNIKTNKNHQEWIVTSSSNTQQEYQVFKVQETCDSSCIMCKDCNICIHTYKCSCYDNLIKKNICKHIHAVARYSSVVTAFESDIVKKEETNSINGNGIVEIEVQMDNDYYDCSLKNENLINKAELLLSLVNTVELRNEDKVLVERQIDRLIDTLNRYSNQSNG